MSRRCISLFILVVIFACNNCTKVTEDTSIKELEILNVETPLKVNYDDIIDSVSYFPLETDNCLIYKIERIIKDENYLFVKDINGLHIFNVNGDFISDVGKKGAAPEEYFYIRSYYLDKNLKQICIISYPDNKLLKYSYSGDLISIDKFSYNFTNTASIKCMATDSLLVYNALSSYPGERSAEYELYTFNKSNIVTKSLFEGYDLTAMGAYYPLLYYPMVEQDCNLFLISALSNVVYRYTNDTILPAFKVNIPNLAPPIDFINKYAESDCFELMNIIKSNGYGSGIIGIANQENLLLLAIGENRTLLTDGNEAILMDGMLYDSDLNIYSSSLFTTGVSDENIAFIAAHDILENREYIMNGDNETLKRIVMTLRDDDNPIVYQYHFKKDILDILMAKIKGN